MDVESSADAFNIDEKTDSEDSSDIERNSTRPVEYLCIKWTINNFLYLQNFNSKKSITSPPFQIHFTSDSWLITVYPYFLFNQENKIQFSLVRKASENKPTVIVTYRFGVKKSNIIWFQQKKNVAYSFNGINYTFCDILDYFDKENALVENKLIVLCEMYVTYPDFDKLCVGRVDEISLGISDLSLDLFNLSKKTETSDAVIQVKDLLIHVHKTILAARSSIFAEMLSNDVSRLKLPDDDYDHIQNILFYIYTANFYWITLSGIDIGLYECAKRFKVQGLMQLLTPVHTEVSSLMKEEITNFTWAIDNFGKLDIKFDECTTSPPFHAGYINAPVWNMDIYPNGCYRAPNSLGIYLRTKDLNKLSHLKIHLSIVDEYKHELYTKSIDKTLYPDFIYGCPEYISKEELHETLLSNDKLILNCKIKSLSIIESCDKIASAFHEEFTCFDRLSADFEKLLLEEYFSDCALVTANRKVFSAHKAILSARSTYFEHIIKESEKDNYVIHINDICPGVLEKILYFCYTAKIKFYDITSCIKLYEGAKLCKILSLSRRCIAYLFYNVDEKSLCEVIAFSYKHEERALFTRCLIYLKMIRDKVLTSKEWENFVRTEELLAYKIIKWLEAPPDKPLCIWKLNKYERCDSVLNVENCNNNHTT